MKVLIIVLVSCLVLQAVMGSPHGGGHSDMCKNKYDGKYAEPGSGCKKYYQCKNKMYHGPYHCQGNYKYDNEEEKCMPPDQAECY